MGSSGTIFSLFLEHCTIFPRSALETDRGEEQDFEKRPPSLPTSNRITVSEECEPPGKNESASWEILMTREMMFSTLQQELLRLTGQQVASTLSEDHLLSQILSSSGFLQLLIAVESKLGITIEDEDFYEAAPITIGDLITFLHQQTLRRATV
jgi:acyl carrier protein